MDKKNIERETYEQLNPSLFGWGYLALKPILVEVKKFAELSNKENCKRILDLGCGQKPYAQLFSFADNFIGFDIEKGKCADVIGLNWDLPFKDNEFDALISTQVLEHTAKIPETTKEIRRVVKDNGLVFISVPFVFPEHGIPYDFYRFTSFGLREIFNEFDIIKIIPSTGYCGTLLRILNIFLNHLPGSKILFPLYFTNNVTAIFLDKFAAIIINKLGKKSEKVRQIYFGLPENYSMVLRNKK